MRRWLLKVLVAVLALVGIFALVGEWKARKLGEWLSGEVRPEDLASRTAAALKLSVAALDGLDKPNVYAYLTAEDCQKLVVERLPKVMKMVPPQSFKTLSIESVEIVPDDGFMTVQFDLKGELATKPVSFDARVEITVAPAFDGAGLALVPIAVRLSFQRVRAWRFDDDKVLPSLLQGAMTPLLQVLVTRVSVGSIPLDLALNKTIDMESLAAKEKQIVALDAPKVPIRLAYTKLAVFSRREGIELVGEVLPVAYEEYDAAVSGLRKLRTELASLPPPPPCEECGFRASRFQEYLGCRERSLRCRAERAFGKVGGEQRILRPVELLALHDLGRSTEAEDREVFAMLQPFLSPRIATGTLTGWTSESVKTLLTNVDGQFRLLREKVDQEIGARDTVSHVAIRRDLLANLISTALARASVKARFAFEDRSEGIRQTLNTGPAPDLKCAANAGGCDSNFEYRGHNPRGCDSDCNTRNCHTILGHKICVDGIDLGCVARKGDCETKKEAERLGYEAGKQAAFIKWKIEKDACEALKELKKTGCEINQGWLVANQGMDVGRIEGEARFSETHAEVSSVNATVNPNLSGFALRGQVGGSSRITASFVFTPLGAGHLACVSQWGDTLTANVGLEPGELSVQAQLDETASAESGELVYRLQEREVILKMSPPPGLALLSQAPQALLACPLPATVLAQLGPVGGPIGHYVQVKLLLSDEIKTKVPAREIRIPLLNREIAAAGGRARVHREAIVFEVH